MNTPSAPHNGNGASHAPARASGPIEARAARRERLLLLCAVDRARLRLLWRMPTKPPPPPRSFGSGLLSPPTLAALLPWVPGKIGRWSRRIRTGANILRTVMRVAA
jgi:hypothetical protein